MRVKYKAVIVGCGKIGSSRFFSHAIAYSKSRQVRLVAAADIDDLKLKRFSKAWKVKRLYRDYSMMIEREKPDIVSICTPPGTHYTIAKKCLSSGARALWCEKPISDNLNKAKEMVQLCAREGIVLAVNYYRRWSAPHQKVKQLIDKKAIGDIQRVVCFYSKGLLNNASHLVDLMHFYFGDIEWVKSGIDDALWFKKGFPASLNALDDRYFRIIEMDIIGTRGRIHIKDAERLIEFYRTGRHPLVKGLKALKKDKVFTYGRGILQPMNSALFDIISCIKKNRSPLCSGEDALKALAVVEAIKESGKKNGTKVKIRHV